MSTDRRGGPPRACGNGSLKSKIGQPGNASIVTVEK